MPKKLLIHVKANLHWKRVNAKAKIFLDLYCHSHLSHLFPLTLLSFRTIQCCKYCKCFPVNFSKYYVTRMHGGWLSTSVRVGIHPPWSWAWTLPPPRHGPGHTPPGCGHGPPLARPPSLPPGSGPRHPLVRPPNLLPGAGPRHPPCWQKDRCKTTNKMCVDNFIFSILKLQTGNKLNGAWKKMHKTKFIHIYI